jgi:hypothetical protein
MERFGQRPFDRTAQRWLNNWGWDFYRWITNYRRAHERCPKFKDYHEYQGKIRQAMWGDK